MAVVAEHALRDMTGNVCDGPIAGAAFRKIHNEGTAIVVPPASDLRILPDISPGRFEGGDGPRRIVGARLPEGKEIPFRTSFTKLISVPCGVFPQDGDKSS